MQAREEELEKVKEKQQQFEQQLRDYETKQQQVQKNPIQYFKSFKLLMCVHLKS